jgi:hypothetical protein
VFSTGINGTIAVVLKIIQPNFIIHSAKPGGKWELHEQQNKIISSHTHLIFDRLIYKKLDSKIFIDPVSFNEGK